MALRGSGRSFSHESQVLKVKEEKNPRPETPWVSSQLLPCGTLD